MMMSDVQKIYMTFGRNERERGKNYWKLARASLDLLDGMKYYLTNDHLIVKIVS